MNELFEMARKMGDQLGHSQDNRSNQISLINLESDQKTLSKFVQAQLIGTVEEIALNQGFLSSDQIKYCYIFFDQIRK